MKINYCTVTTKKELRQILDLQQRNLYAKVSEAERKSDGFVTVEHNYELLYRLSNECPHILAKVKNEVVGYALCMHPKFSGEISLLKPMFQELNHNFPALKGYMVMGQICIDKHYRGKGIFRGLYQCMKDSITPDFQHIVTEVDTKNERSLQAHYSIGFTELLTHKASGRNWKLIILK